MNTRKITAFDQPTSTKKEFQSNASTWGELKSDITRSGINVEGKKGVHRVDKITYEKDDALLPEGEFIVFLFPSEKMKAGDGVDINAITRDLKESILDAIDLIIEDLEDDIASGVYDTDPLADEANAVGSGDSSLAREAANMD